VSTNQSAPEVKIAKAIGYRIIAKKAVRTVIWLIVLAAVVYAIIASSMARYVATNLGTMEIVSTNFPGGYAQPKTVVAIDGQGGYKDNNPLQNLKAAVTPHRDVIVGEVQVGPYGTPDWSSYGFKGMDSKDNLSNQYIVKCLEGCSGDSDFRIVRADQIMGIPVGR